MELLEVDGAGGAGGIELSSNCVFSFDVLLLVTVTDVVVVVVGFAPLFAFLSSFVCFSCGCEAFDGFFDCQFTNSTDTNFLSRSRYWL